MAPHTRHQRAPLVHFSAAAGRTPNPPTVVSLSNTVRTVIIERDGNRCRLCQATAARLHVHHMDGRGAQTPTPNHAQDNLITLCSRCHRNVHAAAVPLTWEFVNRADEWRTTPKINLPDSDPDSDDRYLPLMARNGMALRAIAPR